MPETNPVFGAYVRTGDPTLVARNVYAEQVPGSSGPRIELRARPGLELYKTIGPGPFRGITQRSGLFGEASMIVSGSQVWLLDASGTATMITGVGIGGTGLVDIDLGQNSDLDSIGRIATGEGLYVVTTDTVTKEPFPAAAGPGANSVCYHRGFWFAVEVGTQQAFYQVPGDPAWQALSFASAEYSPDPLVGIRTRGDQFALLGSATMEAWTLTGTATPAIAPYGGLNFDFGCRSLPSAVNCAGSLLWVDNECNVRRWDGAGANIVSGPGMAELIRNVDATDLRAWTFATDSHRFYVLTIGSTATWVYDLQGAGEQWTTFNSLGLDYWLAHLGCTVGDSVFALDNLSNQVYRLAPDRRTDGSTPFAAEISAYVEGADKSAPGANVVLLADFGSGPINTNSVVGMRYSKNLGKTYSGWSEQPLPVAGSYDNPPRWNGVGDIPAFFGIIFRFRISDAVPRIFKRIFLNVP